MKALRTLLLIPFALLMLHAESAAVLESKADNAVTVFTHKVRGAKKFLDRVAGYLVFPEVVKGGLIIGGEYGEGVLRVKGKTKGYYRLISGSIGFQAGLQKRAVLIAFSDARALNDFLRKQRWEAGVDGSIVVVDWGRGKDIGTLTFKKPVYAFVFDSKGLMYNLTLEGTTFQRIRPR